MVYRHSRLKYAVFTIDNRSVTSLSTDSQIPNSEWIWSNTTRKSIGTAILYFRVKIQLNRLPLSAAV